MKVKTQRGNNFHSQRERDSEGTRKRMVRLEASAALHQRSLYDSRAWGHNSIGFVWPVLYPKKLPKMPFEKHTWVNSQYQT